MRLGVLGGCLTALIGCTRPDAPARAALGTERGDCRTAAEQGAIGTCDPGLLCLSNLCVRPPPADCQTVADRVASFELGPQPQAAARVSALGKHKAACEQARVSNEQGACIEAASDRWGAMQCAPAMFPEMTSSNDGLCGQVMERIKSALDKQLSTNADPAVAKLMIAMTGAMRESCEQDGWPDELKKCIVHSPADDVSMTASNAQMPPGVQEKIRERMQKAITDHMPAIPSTPLEAPEP